MEKVKIAELEKTAIRNLENIETPKSNCCGGTPSTNEDACCKLDEDKKENGESGCGCNSLENKKTATACC